MATEKCRNEENSSEAGEVAPGLGVTQAKQPTTQEKPALTGVPFSVKAAKLLVSANAWWGFLLLQGGQLLGAWSGKKAEHELMHTGSLFLAATSVFFMFNFGAVLCAKEDPRAYRSMAYYFFAMCGGSLLLLLFASLIPGPDLLGYPNIFRSLVIMTGSTQDMQGIWVVACAALAAMGFILLWRSHKGKQDQ